MTHTALCCFLVLLLCAASAVAAEPEVIVEMERSRIYQGESVLYRVTLNHVENPSPPLLPEMDDVEVTPLAEIPLDSRRVTIINGRRTETVRRGRAYNYRLTPRKPGVLHIPAPTAEVDGRQLRGKEMTLNVVAPGEQDTVRMTIGVDHESVYPTQPFTVTLSVAVKALPDPVSDRDPLSVQSSPPALKIPWVSDDELPDGLEAAVDWQHWLGKLQNRRGGGFSVNNISSDSVFSMFEQRALTFRPPPEKVRLPNAAGVETDYREYRFARKFIPKRTGVYSFGPATLKGTFGTSVGESGRLKGEDVFAVARSVMVTVKDVPQQGKPDCYVGAVGSFQLSAQLTPKKARVGDPITLTLTLEGQGSLDSAVPPDLAQVPGVSESFKLYEATEDFHRGSCVFTYSLRPLVEGTASFPSIPVAFFDVDQGRYVTLRSKPIPIEVAKADRLSGRQIIAGNGRGGNHRELQAQGEGVFANVTDLTAVRDESIRAGRWLAALGGLIGCYLALAVVAARVQCLQGDPARLRRRAAAGKARRRMRAALGELKSNDLRQGGDDVQMALRGLVADVADLPEAGLTPKDVGRQLNEFGIEDDLTVRVVALLEACDAAQYDVAGEKGSRSLFPAGRGPDALPGLLEALIKSLKQKRLLR